MNTTPASTRVSNRALMEELEKTFSTLAELIRACPVSMLNQSPAAGTWTSGQVVQHIIKSSAGIPDEHYQPADRLFDAMENTLKQIFLDTTSKLQAPEFVYPESRQYKKEELLQALEKNLGLLQTILRDKPLEELCMDFAFPTIGYLTRYEWLRFIIFHTQRHTYQLNNILAVLKKNDENN